MKIFVDVSSGYRAPAIGELFGPFGANPNLNPETSASTECGIQGWTLNKKLSALATYYNRDIKNVIVYEYPSGYINRDRQKDHGVELEFQYSPGNIWNIKASYAFVDGQLTQKFANKDTTFHNLVRRPKNTINLFAGCQVTNKFFASTTIQYSDKRTDIFYDPNNFYIPEAKTLNAYLLWNIYSEYKLIKDQLMIFADAKNLANNKDYSEVYGYNVQGFTINGGVRFKL